MEDKIKRAKELVKHNQVKKISEGLWEIGKNSVSLKVSAGREILFCSCMNTSIFGDINLCYHKIAVLLFEADEEFYKKIDKLLEDYKKIKDLKLKMDADIVINDLENLRRVK